MSKPSHQHPIKPLLAALAASFGMTAWANPVAPTVVTGQATFATSGKILSVTNTPGTIINWQSFSIGQGETTRFLQQSAASAVLNRVIGGNPSSILGALQSNGRVYLINPSGIVFGASARIDVAGLVASSLNLSDADFLAGRNRFTDGAGRGAVENAGTIVAAQGGQVLLVAPDVRNSGIIQAPNGQAILAAGHQVELIDPLNPEVSVLVTAPDTRAVNIGEIVTQGGSAGIFAAIVEQAGIVRADSASIGENGNVVFRASRNVTVSAGSLTSASGTSAGTIRIQGQAGTTEINGTVQATGSEGTGGTIHVLGEQVGILDQAKLDASGASGGGTLLVGGDQGGKNPAIQNARATYVGPGAELQSDATNVGNGGRIIVWGSEAARVHGALSARGGPNGGDGGFIETSGGYLEVTRGPDLTAAQGRAGTWLLDPYDITIGAADNNISGGPNYTATGSPSTISAATIAAQLNAGTSVIVDTTGGGAEQGDITVSSAISKTTGGAASLTLKAHDDITVNAAITSTASTLDVTLTADQDSNNSGAIALNAPIVSNGGNVMAAAAGDITMNSGSTAIDAGSGTVSLTSNLGKIEGDPMGGPKDIVANTVNLNAATGIAANGGAAQFHVDASTISFNNTSSGGVIIYNNHTGPAWISGSNLGGATRLESFDAANDMTVSSVTSAGNLVLRMNRLAINGPVNAGANTVYIAPFSAATTAMSVGGSAQVDLTQAELNAISAANIVLGNDSLGNTAQSMTIASAANVNAGSANLELHGGTVTMGGNTLSTLGQVTVNSTNAINGSASANDDIATGNSVTLIAGTGIGGGSPIQINTPLLASATTTSGNIDIAATGSVGIGTVNAASGAGNVSLSATGSIGADPVPINVTANTLTVSATSIDLDTKINTLSASATGAGGIAILNDGPLTVSNASTASGGSISIESSGTLTANAVAAGGAGNVGLVTTSGDILLGAITAGGAIAVSSAGAIVDNNGGAANITAPSATLDAASGIGVGDALETVVQVLNAYNGNGNSEISNTGALSYVAMKNSSGNIILSGDSNIAVDLIGTNAGDVTLTANGAILDANGCPATGVISTPSGTYNNIIATNFTVSAGGNASLDYQITGALDATGVLGIADLRQFNGILDPTLQSAINATTGSANDLANTNLEIGGTSLTGALTVASADPFLTVATDGEEGDSGASGTAQSAAAGDSSNQTRENGNAFKPLPVCR